MLLQMLQDRHKLCSQIDERSWFSLEIGNRCIQGSLM